MASSAIIGEKVNRIMSNLIDKDEENSKQKEIIERLEMAHIKMEAVLQVSDRWQITDTLLLQWQRKLNHTAEECDNTLLRCNQQTLKEEQMRLQVSQSSFPIRIAHATKSLISSFIGASNDESGSIFANVQRFERYANTANEFLKTVEFAGSLQRYTFLNPLIRHIFTGKVCKVPSVSGRQAFLLKHTRPISSAERGIEAMIGFSCQDFKEPTKGFYVACMLRLSESTDIFDVIIKCVQTVAPHFKFAAEGIRIGLIQLLTQDFIWESPYGQSEFWANVHSTLPKWYHPNPLCCNEHGHHLTSSSSISNTMASSSRLLSNIFPEEVINLLLNWHVPLPDQGTNSTSLTAVHGGSISQNSDIPTLKIGVLVIPHESSEDMEPAADSYALEVIDGKEQGIIHANAHLKDLGEKLFPKAIEYLHQNSESKMLDLRALKRSQDTRERS